MKVPVIGESITEVTLSKWLKGNGEMVRLDEPICEFESDKATLEFPAEAAGRLVYVAAEGDDLSIGALVAQIDTSAVEAVAPDAASVPVVGTASAASEPAGQSVAAGHPSPAAAKVLKEGGVSAEDVTGSGRGGRITKEDAQQAVAKKAAPVPALVRE